MSSQEELEVLEQKLTSADIHDEKYLLKWIHNVFLKGCPPAFIGKKSLLSVYLNAYIQHTPEPNPLCVSALMLMTKPYVKDTGNTLIGDSIIFKSHTLAYDIEDYLESIKCPIKSPTKNEIAYTSFQEDLESLEQKLTSAEDIHSEEHLLKWIHKVFLKGSPPSFIGKKSLLSVYLNAYIQHTPEPNPLCVSAFELTTKPYVKDTGDTLIGDSIIFKITALAYDIEDYLESKNIQL
jgi:Rps23 Pro-64 3,4-dihydroxylase Tpa1-like proline 4-hydroxylase